MRYESRGGVTSIEFSLEELERSAAMLAAAGSELLEGAAKLSFSPQPPTALLLLGTVLLRQRVLAAAGTLAEITALCASRAAEVGSLALDVHTARMVYEQTEAHVARQTNELRGALLPLILMWDLAANKGRPSTQTVEDVINQAPGILGSLLLGPVGAAAGAALLQDRSHGGFLDTTVAQRLYPLVGSALAGLELVGVGPIEVAALNGERTVGSHDALSTMLDLQVIAEREPPGSLLVSTVQGSDPPVHIVTIPGTQSDPLREGIDSIKLPGAVTVAGDDLNPWDAGGIAEAMGLGSQHVGLAVADALAEAGARPGERVVLSGYSQGGIHAANLAGDTRLSDSYDISYVLTLGSPVALAALPHATRALHLEDRQDMVPGTDGSSNPAGRNRVTVYFEGPDPSANLPNAGFGQAHKLANYQDHARELKDTPDLAIGESTAQLEILLAGSGLLQVRSYQLRRSMPPAKPIARRTDAANAGPVRPAERRFGR